MNQTTTEHFQALWADAPHSDPRSHTEMQCTLRKTGFEELSPGAVLIQSHFSSINYKDALAVTGKGKILRNLPLIPGIDVSGTVVSSSSENFRVGQKVLVTGCGLGETICGGYAERVLVPAQDVISLPEGLSLREAMIYGTAGFTAGLALHQLELNGLQPDTGDVLVTGASGGVGSISLQILKQRGYATLAWTRKTSAEDWLKTMGASTVMNVAEKDFTTKPLASSIWAAAIDNVGGEYLSYILPRIGLWGSVASIGLAQSPLLTGTVFPHILRGVNLLGISSGNCPTDLRSDIWHRLATTYKPDNLEDLVQAELTLDQVGTHCHKMIEGKTQGRALVRF